MPLLPAAYLGFDKSRLPKGGGPTTEASLRRLSFVRWLFTHTNWRVAGGYPTIADSVRPSSRLYLLPLGSDGLPALGVGANLQLTAARRTAKAAKWSAPYSMGQSAADILVPQTSIAA